MRTARRLASPGRLLAYAENLVGLQRGDNVPTDIPGAAISVKSPGSFWLNVEGLGSLAYGSANGAPNLQISVVNADTLAEVFRASLRGWVAAGGGVVAPINKSHLVTAPRGTVINYKARMFLMNIPAGATGTVLATATYPFQLKAIEA